MPDFLEPRMYLLQPTVVFAALVNQSVPATYPIESVVYDGVTTGAYTDIKPGMTLLIGSTPGADDLGRQRVRELNGAPATSIVIWVGRSSRGTHDGELTLTDNAYITIWDDRRVWAKTPYIAPDGEIYKDSNMEVGTNTTNPPPVANCGPSTAATIDPVTNVITVLFNGQNSFAVADGATIVSFLWDIKDGTLLVGSALTDDNITATFPAGKRYVELTVTDSNGKSHTSSCFVLADDPANRLSFDAFDIESQRFTEAGQQMTVSILADMPRATYPDGTLCMVWEREPTGTADRDHLLIVGWLDTENATASAGRTGLVRDTTLTILDIAAKLDTLPGFPQSLADDASRDVALIPDITWSYMPNPNLDKYLHYLLHWHSTALELADFTWSGQGADYPFVLLNSDGASLWNQVDRRARAFLPDFVLTCDLAGRIAVEPDPMLRDVADRTAVVLADIDEDEWTSIRFSRQRAPRVHWLEGNAILAGTTQPIGTVFSIAPGEAPGQGVGATTQGEKLVISQAALNSATGHRYARVNAAQGLVTVTLIQNDDGPGSAVPWREIEPARKQWVTLTMSAETAAQRGITFTSARALPKEVNIRYNQTKVGLTRTIEVTLELETVGEPGVTVVKPVVPAVTPVPYVPPAPWSPPLPGDATVYYGAVNAYVMWDGAHVFRTWDLQAASPIWELVDTGITGAIYDGHYVHVNENTIGMWLMTADAIWWCGDIMATTPTWSNVLPIATVRAGEIQQSDSPSVFTAMNHYASEPGYLIVVTSPGSGNSMAGFDYRHAYTWHTHDYGATWTVVDMDAFSELSSGSRSAYAWAGRYAVAIHASSPTIWIARTTSNLQKKSAVFKSTDGGHTWTKEFSISRFSGEEGDGASILAPFPSITDPAYLSSGGPTVATWPFLYTSTDAFATAIANAKPAGYDGLVFERRVNSNTFDPNHVLAWWDSSTAGVTELLESLDAGATWSAPLWSGHGLNPNNVQTPNGWPPDTNVWVNILHRNGGTVSSTPTIIRYTNDKFATMQDKRGNLASLVTSWTAGYSNGFALPRVGPNV